MFESKKKKDKDVKALFSHLLHSKVLHSLGLVLKSGLLFHIEGNRFYIKEQNSGGRTSSSPVSKMRSKSSSSKFILLEDKDAAP